MQDLSHLSAAELIAQGRALVSTIAEAEATLKQIEAELRSRALAMPHEPLCDGHREGRRATLRDGTEKVTVLFESDILKASFDSSSPFAKAVRSMLPWDHFTALFRVKETCERIIKDGHKFRLQCAELLGPDLAASLIDVLKDRDKNGIVKSKASVEWSA